MYVRVEAVRRIGSAEGDTISSTSQTNGFVGNDKDQHAFSVPNRSTVGYPGLQVSMFFRVLRVRERWRCSRVSSIPNAICPPIHSQKCAFSFAGDYRGPDRFWAPIGEVQGSLPGSPEKSGSFGATGKGDGRLGVQRVGPLILVLFSSLLTWG